MNHYIGIGFVILCLSVLAGVLGIFGYQLHTNKENTDIRPATANISISNKTTVE